MAVVKSRTNRPAVRKARTRQPALHSTDASIEQATALLRALGSPHRLAILCLLLEGERTVSEICDKIGARQSLVSQHLTRLRLDRLVKADRNGYFVSYSLTSAPAQEIIATLHKYYCATSAGKRSN